MRGNGDPTDNRYYFIRILIDVVLMIALVILLLFLEYTIDPINRGFFCSDETIRYPLRPETVSTKQVVYFAILLPILIIFVVELKINQNKSHSQRRTSRFGSKVSSWILEFSKHSMFFIFGFLLSYNASVVGKVTISRLRPHFMAVCQPQMLDNSTCESPENQLRYVEDYICVAKGFTDYDVNRARSSFPSGHSSQSFYGLVYMSIYLQHKMTWKGSKLLRHTLQFIFISFAWFVALTRLKDYWHHWSDVVSGILIGVVTAVLTARFITKDFSATLRGSSDLNRRDTITT